MNRQEGRNEYHTIWARLPVEPIVIGGGQEALQFLSLFCCRSCHPARRYRIGGIMYNAASYWREDDEVWLAKLRAYAATLPSKGHAGAVTAGDEG
jgi:hypothetical protein